MTNVKGRPEPAVAGSGILPNIKLPVIIKKPDFPRREAVKKNYLPAIAIFFLISFISCASSPPTQSTPPPTRSTPPVIRAEPIDEPAPPASTANQDMINELDVIMTRVEEARNRAVDFDCPSYFPGEWEDAEARYDLAKKMPKSTEDDVKKAGVEYNAVADLYDAVFALAVPLYAQAREDEIMEIRGELITAGVRTAHPEYFIPADEKAVLALDQYEAEDYYPARDTAANALAMYETLKLAYNIQAARQAIVDGGLEKENPDTFNMADETFGNAVDAYKAGNIPEAHKLAENALTQYNLILHGSLPEYARHHSTLAHSKRQAALEAKADVAVAEMFTGADSVYRNAIDLLESQDYEEAANGFINAETMYTEAAAAALDKRRIAAEAIREAEEEIEKVRQNAENTEFINR